MKKLLLFVMFLISLNSLSEEFKYDNGDRLIVDVVNGKKEGPYKYYFKEDGRKFQMKALKKIPSNSHK